MLAMGSGNAGVLCMELVRAGDVDGVNVLQRGQRLQLSKHRRIEVPGELRTRRLTRITCAGQLHPRVAQEGGQHQREGTSEASYSKP